MKEKEFIARFGGIYEHSPWVAEKAAPLVDGSADVMITDSIEVALQTRRHPELCGTMAQTLTYQEKGYLMPRDDALKTFVDLWLELRMGDGTVNDLIQKYLAAP